MDKDFLKMILDEFNQLKYRFEKLDKKLDNKFKETQDVFQGFGSNLEDTKNEAKDERDNLVDILADMERNLKQGQKTLLANIKEGHRDVETLKREDIKNIRDVAFIKLPKKIEKNEKDIENLNEEVSNLKKTG